MGVVGGWGWQRMRKRRCYHITTWESICSPRPRCFTSINPLFCQQISFLNSSSFQNEASLIWSWLRRVKSCNCGDVFVCQRFYLADVVPGVAQTCHQLLGKDSVFGTNPTKLSVKDGSLQKKKLRIHSYTQLIISCSGVSRSCCVRLLFKWQRFEKSIK